MVLDDRDIEWPPVDKAEPRDNEQIYRRTTTIDDTDEREGNLLERPRYGTNGFYCKHNSLEEYLSAHGVLLTFS